MFSFRLKAFSLSVLLALPSAAVAKPVTMQCLVKGATGGWIAEQLFFEHDAVRNTVRIVDPIVLHFDKKAATGKVTGDTDKKLTFTWRVNTRVGSQTSKMGYRAAFFKGNGKVLISATPHGFGNNFNARGRCQVINQPLPAG